MPGIVVESRKLVYWPVPKNACTSIKTLIARLEGLNFEGLVHDAAFRWTPNSLPGYTDFAVVRHPAGRLYSLWVNKIAEGFPVGLSYVGGMDAAVFGGHLDTIHAAMPFPEFVEAVTSVPIGDADPHWAPQSGQIPNGAVWARLEDAWPLMRLEFPALNISASGVWETVYDYESRARVREYYADDYTRFGYD